MRKILLKDKDKQKTNIYVLADYALFIHIVLLITSRIHTHQIEIATQNKMCESKKRFCLDIHSTLNLPQIMYYKI